MTTQITTLQDLETLWRPLRGCELEKANALIPTVEDIIRQGARDRGCDLDARLASGDLLKSVFIAVVCDVVGRALLANTSSEPVSQYSQSALGYSVSGTYLVPGGGIFIKRSEWSRLGIGRQRIGGIDLYA